jgi:DNA-binding PadR family transcriptional regulator
MSPDARPPMRPIEFYILLALARGALHGYGIMQATEHQSGGQVRLDPGTLYRAIQRLHDAGLLAEADRREAEDLDSERRRFYELTEAGAAAAAEETKRLHGLVRSAVDAELVDETGLLP